MIEPSEDEATLDGIPSLLKLSQVQAIYKNAEEVDDEGNILELKMQATAGFKNKLNALVYELILDCINFARKDGRKMLTEDDVPKLEETTYSV